MYDYGARFYMPDIGRWGVHDPLSELQFKYSPYAYTYNNPIFFNDPTGMIGEDPKKTPEFINGGKPKEIEEVVITKVSPKPSKDSSLSWLGIESLSAYHNSRDRLATAIRGSSAALATEQFEKNLASGIGTFAMGGSNILASSGWAAFDSWLSYQDPEDQKAIAAVQYAAILIQLRHGNIKAAEELIEGQGYKSFKAFKRAMGSAGEGNAWHHIVEQRGNNISLFGAETIHDTNNLIKLPHGAGSIHAKVSGFYSSKQAFTGGQTVRQWLSTQSYQQQYDFGIKTLKQFGWTP